MRSIREEITGKIRDELVAGEFKAGFALRETELAKRFSVSRGPIRDAFLQLSQEGFLAYQVNKGVTVCHPLVGKDRDLIASLRAQVELYVVEKGFERITKKDLVAIGEALEALDKSLDEGIVHLIAKADMAFHESILNACHGGDHVHVWRLLCSRMLLTQMNIEKREEIYEEHLNIYNALRAGNRANALAAIRANVAVEEE
jgi:DNA-binding GntR family transcriptional regulator